MINREKEKLIKSDILSIENRVRHAFNQGYDFGYKDGIKKHLKTGHWDDIPRYTNIAWQCSKCKHFTTMKHNYCPNCGLKMAERDDKETGQWIIRRIENGEIMSCECSNCGSNPIYDFIHSYEEMWIEKLPNYCPNCGFKMEGSQYKLQTYWRAEVMIDGHIEIIYAMEYFKDLATSRILNVASHMAKEKYKLIKIEELHNE